MALAAAEHLKNEHITHIYASPVRRTQETAHIVGEVLGLPVVTEEGLREIGWGKELEDRPVAKLKDYFRVVADRFTRHARDGETWVQVRERMLETLERIDRTHTDARILIVSHSDPIWLLESAMAKASRFATLHRRSSLYARFAEVHLVEPWNDRYRFKSLVNGRKRRS